MLDSPEREGDNAALAAADELAILRQAVAELTFERDRLLNSTLWRMVAPIRAVALRLPGPVQRALGRGVRGGLKSIGLLRGRVQAAATEAPPPPPAASGIVANRVIFVSGEPTTPGHVYRVVRATEAAARAGWDASWMPIQQAPRRMDEIGTAAIVVVWRATWSNTMDWIKLVVGNNGAKLVFDLDDLVFRTELATAETIDGIRSQKLKTDAVVAHYADMHTSLAAADACTCTTIELARHMREFDKASTRSHSRCPACRCAGGAWHRTTGWCASATPAARAPTSATSPRLPAPSRACWPNARTAGWCCSRRAAAWTSCSTSTSSSPSRRGPTRSNGGPCCRWKNCPRRWRGSTSTSHPCSSAIRSATPRAS
jgi:hypothetical protein